jgi:hypothetical protein
MNANRAWQLIGVTGISLGLAALTGCQTNVAGMTLPSGHYLQHPPQYFAPSPPFPLQRELAAMEAQGGPAGQAQGQVGAQPAPLVQPAPGAGALVPPPQPMANQ